MSEEDQLAVADVESFDVRSKAESPDLPNWETCSKKNTDHHKIMDLGDTVQVQQKLIKYNCCCGHICPTLWMPKPYEYHVYKKHGGNFTKALTFGEESAGFKRCVCCKMAAWNSHALEMKGDSLSDNIVMTMEKPYRVMLCCLCVPEANVFHYDGENKEQMGRIEMPFYLAQQTFKVYVQEGNEEKLAYTIGWFDCCNGCCGCHGERMCCVCCDGMYTNTYDIWEGEDFKGCAPFCNPAPKNGEAKKVGKVVKRSQGCGANCCYMNDVDCYDVEFPKDADWKRRAMILQFTVFLDYTVFSMK